MLLHDVSDIALTSCDASGVEILVELHSGPSNEGSTIALFLFSPSFADDTDVCVLGTFRRDSFSLRLHQHFVPPVFFSVPVQPRVRVGISYRRTNYPGDSFS